MDFYRINTREAKGKTDPPELYPDFIIGRSKDLMVRGRSFYAVWDEEAGLWSKDEYDVQRLIDKHLKETAEASDIPYSVKYLRSFGSNIWKQFRLFLANVSDNSVDLDRELTFANTDVKKTDYVSKRLPYPLEAGSYEAWDELIGTLYSVEERAKIEWAIGAVVAGDAKKIQKFLVLYGPAGTGKSTILNVIEALFAGYTTTFEAKALGSSSAAFATEVFKENPLVAIQHDGDLSRIEDNTRLNSIVSHEKMTMNEKYKPSYDARVNAFLFMGTNQPVKISDAKSGIIRRLIDVHPTGIKIPVNRYHTLMSQIEFELGAIAHHCREVYLSMGKNYYNTYQPLEMMFQTDVFFNFIEANFDIFSGQGSVSLRQAYTLYKEFCDETGIERRLPQYKVREELRNYFDEFKERAEIDGHVVRSVYSGFNANKFKAPAAEPNVYSLVMEEHVSLLDEVLADQPAQYAKADGTPKTYWSDVRTTLKDISTDKIHYVKLPENHIVIDFDLKDEDERTGTDGEGQKSLERNLQAASLWPATYGELSKSGGGVHLHYLWTGGDPGDLASKYSDGIEVKVYRGDASLRRKLSLCNRVEIAELNSGLPLKEKTVKTATEIQSERGLRSLIERNLRKEIHPGTKPSVDFIHHILEEAHENGLHYDVTDMRQKILAFASRSTNWAMPCIKTVQSMKLKGKEIETPKVVEPKDDRRVIFDVEVFPNLYVVCWKYEGSDQVVRMINPTAQEIEPLFGMKLVGFYNRQYDNHILYGIYMGFNHEQLYNLSVKLIESAKDAKFGEAFDLSYADIWEYSSKKQSLKKFMIELRVTHMELNFPWNEPVDEKDWPKVVEYCVNDVNGTEAVLEAREADFKARLILAELSGLTPNHTTQQHTARIIFGKERRPQKSFVYTKLEKEFPGYEYKSGKSSYRGEDPSEGGYVYSEPGIYENVAVLDIASMHPTSLIRLNAFGDYTPNFKDLLDARLAIKHNDYASARKMLGGKLAPFLAEESDAKALSYALKIVINIVYGLTSARFENPFKDIRNIDNIVAKRGALFMIDLKLWLQEQGVQVVHIKTDSVKIPNASSELIDAIFDFGQQYGYTFEHETTYEKFCLVNDAVYIAKDENGWEAVGAQFQHPYVFKTLFSGEETTHDDLFETKEVKQGSIFLDFDEANAPWTSDKGLVFIGRIGRFVPVTEESGGGLLWRIKDDKKYAVTGTKGYLWLEAEMFKMFEEQHDLTVDAAYFEKLADKAVAAINKFGSFEEFVS